MARIDVILGLYDQALDKAQQAEAALARHDPQAAKLLLDKAHFALSGLVCAVQGNVDELSHNILRLYEFANHNLAAATADSIAAARGVLQTLREGFEAARDEALRLERTGAIPALDHAHAVRVMA
jgi:flagellin-specific chaperone FliS